MSNLKAAPVIGAAYALVHRGSVAAVDQAAGEAGCAGEGQRQEKEQKSYQDGADDAGCHDSHSQKHHRQQNGSQNAGQQDVQCGTQAGACFRPSRQGCRYYQHAQEDHGDAEGYPEEHRADGNDGRNLEEGCQYTNDGAGCNGGQCTIAFAAAVAIEQTHEMFTSHCSIWLSCLKCAKIAEVCGIQEKKQN